MSQVVNCAAYEDGRRVGDPEIRDIGETLQHPGRFVWVGLHEPSEDLLRQVQKAFDLHDLAIEDAHRAHQRPKLERYENSLFVVLRTARMDPGRHRIDFGETHLFVGPRYVVSVRHGPSLSYAEVRQRCEATPHLLAKGPGFALHAITDFVVDHYFPIVEALEDELEALEEEIFGTGRGPSRRRETTERIYDLKRNLLEVKRAVSPIVDIANRLARTDLEWLSEDTRPYFRDVYDHAARMNELVDTLHELVTSALDANLSLVTVAQNDAMKRLAGWAAIFAVPTMIAGIYGMNFRHMPELDWPYGYPLVMGLTVGACAFLYYKFRRSGWL